MSPEQARGIDVDARADLFSLGLVMFYCLTGELLYQGATTLRAAASRRPPARAPDELARIARPARAVRRRSWRRRCEVDPDPPLPERGRVRGGAWRRTSAAARPQAGGADERAVRRGLPREERASRPRSPAIARWTDRTRTTTSPSGRERPETPQPSDDSGPRRAARAGDRAHRAVGGDGRGRGDLPHAPAVPRAGRAARGGGRQRVDPVAGAARHAHPARRRRAGDSRRRSTPICCPSSRRAGGSGGCRSTRSPTTCSRFPQGDAAERSVGSGRTQPAPVAGAPGRLPAVRDPGARGARSPALNPRRAVFPSQLWDAPPPHTGAPPRARRDRLERIRRRIARTCAPCSRRWRAWSSATRRSTSRSCATRPCARCWIGCRPIA